MSSEGPYGRQGFQSNPSGYGGGGANYAYGGGDQQPAYGGGQGYGGGASYGAPPPQQGGYGGGIEYNPYGTPTGGGEYEVCTKFAKNGACAVPCLLVLVLDAWQ